MELLLVLKKRNKIVIVQKSHPHEEYYKSQQIFIGYNSEQYPWDFRHGDFLIFIQIKTILFKRKRGTRQKGSSLI
jgi:hypothetical protein